MSFQSMRRTLKLRRRIKLSRILGIMKRKRNADDIISEVNKTFKTTEVPVDDFPDIPSDADTFGSDISVSSYSTDHESDRELDRRMQPDYDDSDVDGFDVDGFDILGTSEPVTSRGRELINIDIRDLCPTVYNQHGERSCLAVSSSDMTTGVLRKHGVLDKNTILSPQPLLDSGISYDYNSRRLETFMCDSKLGFPSITTYGFLGMERPIEDWSWKKYRESKHKKHPICGLKEVCKSEDPGVNHNTDGPIIDELEANFRSDGKQYPLVCSMDFSDLLDGEVAKKYSKGRYPYHHKKQLSSGGEGQGHSSKTQRESNHAVLVVGYNNTPNDCMKRRVTIKNSHGKDWADDGYTDIGLDALDSVFVPDYNPDRWAELKKRVELKKNAKKRPSCELSPKTTLESSFRDLTLQSLDDEPDQEADGNDKTYASWDEEYGQFNDGNAYSDIEDSSTLVSQPHL